MVILNLFLKALTQKERMVLIGAAVVLIFSSVTGLALAIQDSSEWVAVAGGSYKEGVLGQPIAVNPIISANQIDQDISRLIYSNLFDLIDDYEIEQEGRVYVLKLKESLLWDNGQPLTSDDVIFTIETIQDPDSQSPLAKNWKGVVAERVSELRVRLALPTPYVFFIQNIKKLPIIPVHIFGNIPAANLRLSSYNLEPVGSGPYRFESFTKRKDGFISQYRLAVNDNYHGQKPFIEDFYFVFYEEEQNLIKDFLLRNIDGFGSLIPFDTSSLPPNNVVINHIPMPRYYSIFFNPNVNPTLKREDFRYGLTAAINKRAILQEVFENRAELIDGPLGNFLESDGNKNRINYNPDEARKRLESLKIEKIEVAIVVPEIEFLKRVALMIKEDWLSVGIDEVSLVTLPSNELLESVIRSNNYEMILFGNALEHPLDLFPFWHSSQRFYPGLNLSLYKNSRVDNLIEETRQAEDEDEQRLLAGLAQDLIVEEAPAIFLFSIPYTYIHTKRLEGFLFDSYEEFIITPSDRFIGVNDWHVAKARVLK